MRTQLTRARNFAQNLAIRLTGYLWIVGGFAVYRGYVNSQSPAVDPNDDFAVLASIIDSLDPVSYDGMVAWGFLLFFSSLMSVLWKLCSWRGASWLSLLAWSAAVGTFAGWAVTADWIPRAANYSDQIDFSSDWATSSFHLVANFFDLGIWIAAALFWVVFKIHSTGNNLTAVGGRWRPFWAGAAGVFIAVMVSEVNPIILYVFMSDSFSSYDAEPTVLSAITQLAVHWSALLLPWMSAFGLIAWKTRAGVSVSDEKMTVSLGDGLELLRIKWQKVLSTTEVLSKGKRHSVTIEHGVLPWYRMRFGLHAKRDGSEVLESVWRLAPNKRKTELRRGASLAGFISIIAGLACAGFIQWKTYFSHLVMSESDDDFVQTFVGQDHFLLFGIMMLIACVLFGAGFGMLFSRNYAGVRALPLLAVAFGAMAIPDPVFHWLVYIAMYAILSAQLSPVEYAPYIPFPDSSISTFGMWTAANKPLFAAIGYVIGTILVVKPWTRFLPMWPYSLSTSKVPVEDRDSIRLAPKHRS